jgi:hypothetical protein
MPNLKHETVKIEYLRDLIREGLLTVEWIGTADMVADGLLRHLGGTNLRIL